MISFGRNKTDRFDMSLDVYLEDIVETTKKCQCITCDHEHEHTSRETFFSANLADNLMHIAHGCGLYDAIWRPNENGFTVASQIIPILEIGLEKLKSDPHKFYKYEPENWSETYDYFVNFVYNYLLACLESPHAFIKVSR